MYQYLHVILFTSKQNGFHFNEQNGFHFNRWTFSQVSVIMEKFYSSASTGKDILFRCILPDSYFPHSRKKSKVVTRIRRETILGQKWVPGPTNFTSIHELFDYGNFFGYSAKFVLRIQKVLHSQGAEHARQAVEIRIPLYRKNPPNSWRQWFFFAGAHLEAWATDRSAVMNES